MRWSDVGPGERLLAELDWESAIEAAAQALEDGDEEQEQEEAVAGHLLCRLCGLPPFDSLEAAQTHRLSKRHAANQRRRLQGLPPLVPNSRSTKESEEEDATDDDVDTDNDGFSTDAFLSSDEDDQVAEASAAVMKNAPSSRPVSPRTQNKVLRSSGSPFIEVSVLPGHESRFLTGTAEPLEKDSKVCLKIYKQLILSPKDIQGRDFAIETVQKGLKALVSKTYTWTLLMVASGHFAGAVMDQSGKVLLHKTFHRYTTRRKQGGGQAGKDGSGKVANSAGSTLRRYNEQALKADIQQLLQDWKPQIASSSTIFVRAKHNNRAGLEVPGILDFGSDPRIRSFPFTTGRPTLEELKRSWEELSTVKIHQVTTVVEERTQKKTKPPAQKAVSETESKLSVDNLSLEPQSPAKKSSQEFIKASDLIRRGKTDLLKSLLQGFPSLLTEVSPSDGNSLIHLASAQSQSDTVLFLLTSGADASLRNTRKQTPYQVATAKPTRDVFRRFIADVPEPTWDIKASMIPGPLTKEMEEAQKAKEREKRRKNKERSGKSREKLNQDSEDDDEESTPAPPPASNGAKKKSILGLFTSTDLQSVGMTEERRKLLDREKRALAAEARMRTASLLCAACARPMAGLVGFDKGGFKYCSMDCVKAHNGLHAPI